MDIFIPVAIVAALALLAALMLAIASIVFAVPKDEKTEELRALLPGANCGACGYSGCDGYAAAMAHEGAAVGLCSPGGSEVAKATGMLLGVNGEVVRKIARVHCAGNCDAAPKKLDYEGVPKCAAAAKFFRGDKLCAYGCLGYGDCVAACEYDAIHVENGVATVDSQKCTGCGLCAKACPKLLITLAEVKPLAAVNCRSHDKGVVAKNSCQNACIGCMKCQKVCPTGAARVTEFLAEIDPALCTGCGACTAECPRGCIELLYADSKAACPLS